MRKANQRSLVFAAALLLGVVAHHTSAEAKCAGPQSIWSLDEGEVIAAEATLYFFEAGWSRDKGAATVLADGKAIQSQWTQVSKNDAFTTFRLRFNAGKADRVQISRGTLSQEHPVRKWSAPKEARATASLGKREQDSWTCSHIDVIPLQVKSAATAFRVQWSDLRNGSEDHGHGETIFPRSTNSFWRYDAEKPAQFAAIQLGHPNCFAYNLPEASLNSLDLKVTPLYRDGTEGKTIALRRSVKTKPAEVIPTPAPAVAPMSKVERMDHILQQTDAPALHLQRQESTPSPITLRLLVIALLLGTLFGLLIFRSHRHGVATARIVRTGAVVSLLCGGLAFAATLVGFPFYLLFLAGGLGVLFYAARHLEVDED